MLIIGAVVLLVKALSGNGVDRPGSVQRSALDILKERYAQREIDRQQFEQIKRDFDM